ncbi:hypothetical protein DENSPDRAFT_773194 [Dentipellis sp. KUC8613]|nr:hypothetical protein DENSPDRAFT_773194 [Dentipellis sp. KUC8613]
MSQRNGHLESEVIVNYADGFAYSKGKMEEACRTIFDKPLPKPAKSTPGKKEDIDLIVSEFDIPRAQAEKVLSENDGSIQKALQALVSL